jgi:hypothetical protein
MAVMASRRSIVLAVIPIQPVVKTLLRDVVVARETRHDRRHRVDMALPFVKILSESTLLM